MLRKCSVLLTILAHASANANCDSLERDHENWQRMCDQLGNASSEVASKAPGFLGLLGLAPGGAAFAACEAAKRIRKELEECLTKEQEKKAALESAKEKHQEKCKENCESALQKNFDIASKTFNRQVTDSTRDGQLELESRIEQLENEGVDIEHPESRAYIESIRLEIEERINRQSAEINSSRKTVLDQIKANYEKEMKAYQ